MLPRRLASVLVRHAKVRFSVGSPAQSKMTTAAILETHQPPQARRWVSSGRRTDSSLEDAFEAACSSREIPGAVLLATNRTGTWNYLKSFGRRSVHESAGDEPVDENSAMWIASCTKLVTSIAAMQLVERGLVGLDDDVRETLHELRDIEIIKPKDAAQGASSGLVFTKNVVPITLRQLLTHTSGFAYEFNDPLLQEWRRQQPEDQKGSWATMHGRFHHPLVFEPGTSWSYGPSIDWAGLLVERLTGLKLEDYMIRNIWKPLGIEDMTFFLSTKPELQARSAAMAWRVPDSPAVVHAERQPTAEADLIDCLGGGGIFASPAEYIKIQRALLSDVTSTDGSEGVLLRRSTAELMFEPQLNEPARKTLQFVSEIPRLNLMLGGMPPATKKDWGLGGMLVMDDVPGWRQKGVLTWGGTPNLTWIIDRKADLAAMYAGQLMPIGDKRAVELTELFEREMYALSQQAKST